MVVSAASINASDDSNAHITLSNAGCVITTSAPLVISHPGRQIIVNSTNFTFPTNSGTIAIKETYNIPSADVNGSNLLSMISTFSFSNTPNWKLFSTAISFSDKYKDDLAGKCFYVTITGSNNGSPCYAYGLIWSCDSTFPVLSGYAMLVSLQSSSDWQNSVTIFGMTLTAL